MRASEQMRVLVVVLVLTAVGFADPVGGVIRRGGRSSQKARHWGGRDLMEPDPIACLLQSRGITVLTSHKRSLLG